MSGFDIPLWKQELLKRKQTKLSNEKSQKSVPAHEFNSKDRLSNAKTNSTGTNHHLADSEKRSTLESGKQNVLDKNNSYIVHNSQKRSTCNRNIVSMDTVDSSGTRQRSGLLKPKIDDSGPSRLDSFEQRPNGHSEKYGTNYNSGSNIHNIYIPGMHQGSRGHHKNVETTNRIIDDSEKNRVDLAIDHGVEREHISPRELKKMWQQQTTKSEVVPKSHGAKNLSSKSQHPSNKEIPNLINAQVGSSGTSAPKAYKSPYAKTNWHRPTSVTDDKQAKKSDVKASIKSTNTRQVEKGEVKSQTVQPSLSNGDVASKTFSSKDDDGVEHIQSVKSLLGLFGGKAKPNINRKVSDNSFPGSRNEKAVNHVNKRPGLYKHHSEPNLYLPTDDTVILNLPVSSKSKASPTKSPTSPKKSSTSPVKSPTTDTTADALPSHHVSQGIQDRMTRLRRASHSGMEDMDGFVEYENRLNGQQDTKVVEINSESSLQNKKQNLAQTSPVIVLESNSTKLPSQHSNGNNRIVENNANLHGNMQPTVKKSFGIDKNHEYPYNKTKKSIVQTDNEKPGLSGAVNTGDYNRLSNQDTRAQNGLKSQQNAVINNTFKGTKLAPQDQSLAEKPSNEVMPAFESNIAKSSAVSSDLTDTNEQKSKNKYQSKQSNYAVDINQSDSGFPSDEVSTERLTEIKKNKQDQKSVIKNEETVNNTEQSVEKKPRRKGLNIVDPLAVLQLTKDPLLLKEKPSANELGLSKPSPTGKVEIIKHTPDRKNQIAQINRAWDLDNHEQNLKQNDLNHKNMPASSVQVSPVVSKHIPVTSIDEIPVSVIDDSASSKPNSVVVEPHSNINGMLQDGNTAFYNGTLLSGDGKVDSPEGDEEFIPVSSIDDEVDLGPPPEIVFDTMPGNLKSCFAKKRKVFILYVLVNMPVCCSVL